ncbi:MAG: 1-phosphofructokinase [Terriglobia bacterium]|jgi:1-phosphofructokinase
MIGFNMIATITLNPAIDKSVTVRGFEIGKTNRGEVDRVDAGGKGINVAKALKRLGSTVWALGLVAGSNGRFILDALSAEGIPADFVNVPGETRVNLKIRDPEKGTETELNEPGFRVTAEHLEELRRKIEAHAPRCEVMVFSGSLPPDSPPTIFADLIRTAKAQGAKCFLDTAGPGLKHGLAAGPFLIKPNRAEAEDLLKSPLRTRRELVGAARALIRMGSEQVLISLGVEGAVGVAGMEALFAAPPAVKVRSSVGAGDTMVAAMAYAAVAGLPFRQAFRMAVAASAATVAMEGSKVADLAAVQELIPQVTSEDLAG